MNQVAVREREVGDGALRPGRGGVHPPHPGMLERMMLGLDEDMEAEHGLEQRRIRVRDAFDLRGRQVEADSDRIFFLAKELTRMMAHAPTWGNDAVADCDH